MSEREDIPKRLFNLINRVEPYPNDVEPVDKMLDGIAFFPGGKGLWCKEKCTIFPKILVLGQDFSTVDYFNKIKVKLKSDLDSPTWKNLLELFKFAGINPCNCFFSNVFMGLRKSNSMIGKFPGAKDPHFYKRNVEFLKIQIEITKPAIIIVLGSIPAKMISELSDDLKPWSENKSFSYYDKKNLSYIENAKFTDHKSICIRLLHPSFRKLNLKYRYFEGSNKCDVEVMLLKKAWSSVNCV